MPDIISPTPNEVLQALLNAHGYEAKISHDRIVVIGHEAQWSGECYVHSPDEPAHLQLDVRLHLPDGRTLIESFSGLGRTLKFALGDAFDSFSRSSFHVLLNAFFAHSSDATAEEWQLPQGRFTALVGDVTLRGNPPVEGEELVRWFEPFAHLIQHLPLAPHQDHWVRLYYAQNESRMVVCECLVDNDPWEALQRAVTRLPFPIGEEFYSERVFLVLKPHRS